jgi:hypothetical protein
MKENKRGAFNMIRIRNVKVISVQDWDDLVEKTYGRPYNFQQQDGCKERRHESITIPDETDDFENDTVPEKVNHEDMGVSFAAWLARDPKQKLNAEDWDSPSAVQLWWHRNFYPSVQMIANDLHAKGLIDAGEYEINIDW